MKKIILLVVIALGISGLSYGAKMDDAIDTVTSISESTTPIVSLITSTAVFRTYDNQIYAGNTNANVGIGLTVPTAKLTVNNGITGMALIVSSNNGTNFLTIPQSGNVGIGTTAPLEKLDVIGNISNVGLVFSSGSASTFGMFRVVNSLDSGDVNHGSLNVINNVAYGTGIGHDSRIMFSAHASDESLNPYASLGLITEGDLMGGLHFNTRSAAGTFSEKMRISNVGNIGIGNTNPLNKLDIAGDISQSGVIFSSGAGTSYLYGNLKLLKSGSLDTILTLNSGSSANSSIVSMGQFNTEKWQMFIPASSDNLIFYDVAGTGANQLVLQKNGNVGIGNVTAPTNKLHINGDISISSRPFAELNWHLMGTSVTLITTAGVYETVAGTSTLENAVFFEKLGNAGVKCLKAGVTHYYHINISGCVSTDAGTPTTAEFAIYRNGVDLYRHGSPYISVQAKDSGFGLQCTINLTQSDYIEIKCTTDDGDDLILDHMQMVITPID